MKQKIKIRIHRLKYDWVNGEFVAVEHHYEDNEAEYNIVPYQEPIRFWDEPKRIDTDHYEQQATERLEIQNE